MVGVRDKFWVGLVDLRDSGPQSI